MTLLLWITETTHPLCSLCPTDQVCFQQEVMDVEEEKSEGETEEESSEYEEYTDSEEETGPRLKPVFVRK